MSGGRSRLVFLVSLTHLTFEWVGTPHYHTIYSMYRTLNSILLPQPCEGWDSHVCAVTPGISRSFLLSPHFDSLHPSRRSPPFMT